MVHVGKVFAFHIAEVKETEKQLQRSQEQLSTSEEIARQLRMKEDDFTEALNAKDSQLAVLRVRIQESDQELQSKRQQIEEYQLERERYCNMNVTNFCLELGELLKREVS